MQETIVGWGSGVAGAARPHRAALSARRTAAAGAGLPAGPDQSGGAEEWLAARGAGRRSHAGRDAAAVAAADWDADAVRDDLRAYVVEHLGDREAVLVVDETGFLKKGHEVGRGAAPVQRHGGAHRELPDRRVPGVREPHGAGPSSTASCTCPKEWAADAARREEAAVPDDGGVPHQAATGARDAGAGAGRRRAGGVGDRRTRSTAGIGGCGCGWKSAQLPHVLAVKRTEPLWTRDGLAAGAGGTLSRRRCRRRRGSG